MIYQCSKLAFSGAFLLVPNVSEDARGSVAKTFHKPSFVELGIDCDFEESLISNNIQAGVIRGFHFQIPPFAQAKTIYCITGAITSVILDLRVGSPTYGKTQMIDISAKTHGIIYIPVGIGNCYVIREPNTIISYNLTSHYMPAYESGVRFDSVGVDFSVDKPIISQRDLQFVALNEFKSPFVFNG